MEKVPDEHWMRHALNEARRGCGLTRPNPPVGAVIVDPSGRMVADGWHCKAGTDHAEKAALRKAGDAARGCDLYVTLEPCSTHGRTEPCTDWIIRYGIRRVFVGSVDPNPKHAGRGLDVLRAAGIEVAAGVLQKDCNALIAPFSKWILTGKPLVQLKLAASLDGRIADADGRSKWITGPEARDVVQQFRREADAVMVGSGTVLADNPSLLPRPAEGRETWRVLLDTHGRIPLDAKVLTDDASAQTIMICGQNSVSPSHVQSLRETGAEVVLLPEKNGHVDMQDVMTELGRRGLLCVFCEGGSTLAGALIREKIVNELLYFIAPTLIGGDGCAAVGGTGWKMNERPGFFMDSMDAVGSDWLCRGHFDFSNDWKFPEKKFQ
ncbi:MAG: bifunctional diaminohydroxyphosphoribosylaminopyrimidine deaminase/5-amino-6-(5-phosphoribosylamino)uracil reductase RibD [Spartobacteria bacterium]|nr:bifunctional diaminohydroxyphosphoribosylaminopyrimidine deaminase/5-amino-6-(5-phosphoribosylamino)uracil reductase RibD [Spartobacteria bacterium]